MIFFFRNVYNLFFLTHIKTIFDCQDFTISANLHKLLYSILLEIIKNSIKIIPKWKKSSNIYTKMQIIYTVCKVLKAIKKLKDQQKLF